MRQLFTIKFGVLLLPVCMLFSCRKMVTIDTPINEIQTGIVFANDSTAQGAVLGLYSAMMQTSPFMMNAGTTIYAGLAADELKPNSGGDYDFFYNNAIPPGNGSLSSRLWQFAYTNLYQVNITLEGLERSNTISAALKKQLRGEVLFVRSLYYFYLVNLFGDVPLIITSDYRANAVMPRSSTNDIYRQMVADLVEAKELLQPAYPTPGRLRPNKYTATALLARVYLFMEKWPEAEANASEIINSGVYSLVTNLNNVFVMTTNEAIWQLAGGSASSNTGEGSIFIPFSATSVPALSLQPALFNAFEANDQRKVNWVKSATVNNVTYTYPFKYKIRSGTTGEYNVVFRLAEIYLIRAEARAKQHNTADAKLDLNLVRARAGLPGNTSADEASLLLAIEQERRIELFAEWGHRFFDLKRTGRAHAVLSAVKPGWTIEDALFPIPQSDIDRNPFLVQNPGY